MDCLIQVTSTIYHVHDDYTTRTLYGENKSFLHGFLFFFIDFVSTVATLILRLNMKNIIQSKKCVKNLFSKIFMGNMWVYFISMHSNLL